MAEGNPARILVAPLIYNGRDFVPQCLKSLAAQVPTMDEVDVLVLDDCSPEPGFSDELNSMCEQLGFAHYRSPRNLGIPRNMNLALLRGRQGGYDHVILLNSDVLLSSNLVSAMVEPVKRDDSVASVTAWSNNVSIFSLPNEDAKKYLTDLSTVNWVGRLLQAEFGSRTVDLPSAVGFCTLISMKAAEAVGYFDPIFGRGYCEEIDWTQRASALGFKNVLAPGAFAYHAGSGSTRHAGVLHLGESSVPGNEAIIDHRYPKFRTMVGEFVDSAVLSTLVEEAKLRIVRSAALEFGYRVDLAWLPRVGAKDRLVRFTVHPDGDDRTLRASYLGFSAELNGHDGRLISRLERFIGRTPTEIGIFDRGRQSDAIEREASTKKLAISVQCGYPERV